ncbi:hypothetical protein Q8F55_008354 [Vanrija albida]|uniref:Major facilitator superfamily (MFS) profile domain-containing protein n=1 Tax=Vanrija albida TaxID=181172 RepID=A0ABR3PW49_9TREE
MGTDKKDHLGEYEIDTDSPHVLVDSPGDVDPDTIPTEEELSTLRKVPAGMPLVVLLLCLVEFAERASYYGSSGVFFSFIKNPLPAGGSGTGAVAKGEAGKNQKAGALGRGMVTANALTTTFSFLAYVVPILGAILADTKLGRWRAIWIGTIIGAFAHILLIIPAIPKVILHPEGSLAAFIISILILAFAAGFIKPSLAPLLCDQLPVKRPTLKTLKSGERVVVDPEITLSRWLVIFYLSINIGGFFALATTYSERLVGFWLAFVLPAFIYILMPINLLWASNKLYKAPPQGSVVLEAWSVVKILLSNGGWRAWKKDDAWWDRAKPSHLLQRTDIDPAKVFWDDTFVDEIRTAIKACAVFVLVPIFNLSDGGIGNQMGAMSNAMILNNVPSDISSNFNPLAIIIFSPILTYGIYPFFIWLKRPVKPMTRMSIGFLLATIGCIVAAILQARIYATSPCGKYASTCEEVSKVNLWWQIVPIVVPAIGELFVNVTAYEIAYTQSPARMKGLVYALFLFATAISSAISLALSDVIDDPNLVWPWVALACASFIAALVFPTYFRYLNHTTATFADKDRQEGRQQNQVNRVVSGQDVENSSQYGRDHDKY